MSVAQPNAVDPEAGPGECLHLLLTPGSEAVSALVAFCGDGDAVVLLNTAVTLLAGEAWSGLRVPGGIPVFAHRADVLAQGLQQVAAEHGVAAVDDDALLALVARYSRTLSWK